MIINNQHIGPIQICNTYDNVLHLDVNSLSSLYNIPSSIYSIFDGNGNILPFKFIFNAPVLLNDHGEYDPNKTIIIFDNCTYSTTNKNIINSTVTNLLTTIVLSCDNEFKTSIGVVNHLLDINTEHPNANDIILQNIPDAIANYEYFKNKASQLKTDATDFVNQYKPKDALIVAYTNNGTSLEFEITESQILLNRIMKLAIIGTAFMYIGERNTSASLTVKVNGVEKGIPQTVQLHTYASTGKGGDAECSVCAAFTHIVEDITAGIYSISMNLPVFPNSSSLVVLCGE